VDNYCYLRFLFYCAPAVAVAQATTKGGSFETQSWIVYGGPIPPFHKGVPIVRPIYQVLDSQGPIKHFEFLFLPGKIFQKFFFKLKNLWTNMGYGSRGQSVLLLITFFNI